MSTGPESAHPEHRAAGPRSTGTDTGQGTRCEPVAADLGSIPLGAADGAIWSLPHGGDLDANLVRLRAGSRIAPHVNDEVDVLIVVQSGGGRLVVDDDEHELRTEVIAYIPAGTHRQIDAGPRGLTYLTVHRARGPLTIGPPPAATGGAT